MEVKKIFSTRGALILFIMSVSLWGNAQSEDCMVFEVVCSNAQSTNTPTGSGIDDFADPDNDSGCLFTEHESAWFYFEFNANTPANSTASFVIDPIVFSDDYDFALYGPNVTCDNLGSPIRCSYSGVDGPTGLSASSTDTSEGAGGDAFVSEITVNPGDGFYLLIDNFSTSSSGFDLSWSGSGTDFLACDPDCELMVSLDPSMDVCEAAVFTINSTVTGATGSETYDWVGAAGEESYLDDTSSPNPEVTLPPGFSGSITYTLTVTDGSCIESASITINTFSPPVPNGGSFSFCDGGDVTLDAGGGFSSYLWSSGDNSQTIVAVAPGTYEVTVTDNNSCTGVGVFTVTQNPPLVVDINGDMTICDGGSTTLMATTGFDTYLWSTGESSASIFVDAPGLYEVTVTDNNSCTGVGMFTVSQNPPVVVNIDGDLVICDGGSTILTATMGFDTYLWSNGAGTASISVNAPGLYEVTVTDSNMCTGTNNVFVSNTTLPPITITAMPNILCDGGSVVLDAGGGFTSYFWSTGELSSTIDVFTPGTYQVTVTGSTGCEQEGTIDVLPGMTPNPIIDGILEICQGNTTTLTVNGGNFISYIWSTGAHTQSIDVSTAGVYSVTVANQDRCEGEAQEIVIESPPLTPQIIGDGRLCSGETGLLELIDTYQSYQWSTGDISPQIQVFSSGLYSVTVSDSNGCVGEASFEVIVSDAPDVMIEGELTFCENGETRLFLSENFDSYLWSDGSSQPDLIVNSPGVYSVTVSNSEGCPGENAVTVVENPSPIPVLDGPFSICPEGGNEIISVLGSYSAYSWSTGATTQAIVVDMPGIYSVTVTDGVGCTGIGEWTVMELPPFEPEISGVLFFCAGNFTTLSVGDYDQILWSDGTGGNSVDVFNAGTIGVTVTDANGCLGMSQVLVDEFPISNVEIIGPDLFCDGELVILETSGDFASYQWSTGDITPTIVVDATNEYWVTVTDDNGCMAVDEIYIQSQSAPEFQITGSSSFCPGSQTTLSVTGDFAEYQWSNGSITPSIDVSIGGLYSVTVWDDLGCNSSESITVQEQADLNPAISGNLAFCEGGETVLDAGLGYDTYLWSTGDTGNSIIVSAAGVYSVSVSDDSGCSGETFVEVMQNSNPTPQIIGADSICTGNNTELMLSTGYDNYSWSTGDVSPSIEAAGDVTYSVTVTDNNGCVGETSHSVGNWTNPLPNILGETNFCPEGSSELTVDGDFPIIEWSTGSTLSSITVSTESTFEVRVTDANGCTGSGAVSTAFWETEWPDITGSLVFCPDESTELQVSQSFIDYQWSNGDTTSSSSISSSGNIFVSVTDEHGCQTVASETVEELNVDELTFSGETTFCTGEIVTIGLADEFSTYAWSTGEETPTIEVTEGGIYAVSVGFENSCMASSSINIIENPLPDVQIGGSTSYCVGSSTVLNAGDTYSEYQWSTGETSFSIDVATQNTYSLTVTDENGCINDGMVDVIQDDALHPIISGNLSFCENGSTFLDAGDGFSTYQWSNDESSQVIEVDQAGTYLITVSDAGGCIGEASVLVAQNPLPNPTITGTFEYCADGSTTLSAGDDFASYAWSNGSDLPSISVSQPGDYTVTVTNEFDCSNQTSQAVVEHPLPIFDIQGQDFFCQNASTTLAGPEGMSNYQWADGATTEQVTIDEPGLFQLEVTDENGCSSTESMSVQEISLPSVPMGTNQQLDCDTDEVPIGAELLEINPNWVFHWEGPSISDLNMNEQNPIVTDDGTYILTVEDSVYGCVSDQQSLDVVDLSYDVDIEVVALDSLDCHTSSVRLSTYSSQPLGSGIQYQWYKDQLIIEGAKQDFYNAESPGYYSIEVLDTLTACFGSDGDEVIENLAFPVADAGEDELLDCNISEVSIGGVNSQVGTGIVYEWTTLAGAQNISGNNDLFVTISAPGRFRLVVRDTLNGCENVDTVQVNQNIIRPMAEAGDSQILDCHTEEVLLDGTASSTGDEFSYAWHLLGNDEVLSTENILTVGNAGTYQLLVVNTENGCQGMDEVVVGLDDNYPQGLIVEEDAVTCFGDSDGGLSIVTVIGDDEGPFVYSIDGEAYTSSPVFSQLEAGEYTLTVQNPEGCEYSEDFIVEEGNDLTLDLGEDQFISLGDSTTIVAETGMVNFDQLATVIWMVPDSISCAEVECRSIIANPYQTTDYQLTVIDENGCQRTDDITVFVEKPKSIFVPSGFSPNGDGINDILMIYAGKDVAYVRSFLIFNRWGENVFEVYNFPANTPAYGWNGYHKGKESNAAVFVYTAEVVFIDGGTAVFSGDITLMK